jgi:hypothetical protein
MSDETLVAIVQFDALAGCWIVPTANGRVVAGSIGRALRLAGYPSQGWFDVSEVRQTDHTLWFALRQEQPAQDLGDNRQMDLFDDE